MLLRNGAPDGLAALLSSDVYGSDSDEHEHQHVTTTPHDSPYITDRSQESGTMSAMDENMVVHSTWALTSNG